MVQKYFNLDEAAQVLGITKEELNRLREQGEIRAFADRGTWKFRTQDIEESARQRGVGSDPEMPMLDEPEGGFSDDQILVSEQEVGPSDSSTSSTILGMGATGDASSDSDIRLVPELADKPQSDSDVKLVVDLDETKPASDSDVKVVDAQGPGEDSDVRLEDSEPSLLSDSDITLATNATGSSDSDVRLEPAGVGSSDELVIPEEGDSDFELASGDASSESDITIAPSDSGISLGQPTDSGISLEQPDDLDLTSDASAAQTDETELEIPLAASQRESGSETAEEMDLESDFELAPLEAGSESSAEVVSLEDEPEVDESAATNSGTSSAVFDDVGASAVDMGAQLDVEEEADELATVPGRAPEHVIARSAEQEWGTLPFAGLCASTLLLALTGIMMLDLVRNVWSWGQPNAVSGGLVGLLKGALGF